MVTGEGGRHRYCASVPFAASCAGDSGVFEVTKKKKATHSRSLVRTGLKVRGVLRMGSDAFLSIQRFEENVLSNPPRLSASDRTGAIHAAFFL